VQHAAYVATLAGLVRVLPLPVQEDLPDSCFVDDCAVVVGDRALLARPGAPSRAEEPERLLPALAELVAEVRRMTAPATLDGGDVLRLGRTLVVGASRRTNRAGGSRAPADWASASPPCPTACCTCRPW
jgi:dimethylargininase